MGSQPARGLGPADRGGRRLHPHRLPGGFDRVSQATRIAVVFEKRFSAILQTACLSVLDRLAVGFMTAILSRGSPGKGAFKGSITTATGLRRPTLSVVRPLPAWTGAAVSKSSEYLHT